MSNIGQRLFPFAIAACVLLLDRITKGMIKASFSVWDTPHAVIPGLLNWTLAFNTGAAFSFLHDQAGWAKPDLTRH